MGSLPYLPDATIALPPGGTNLFPAKVGPQIIYVPDRNAILKAGVTVKMREADTMRFISSQTSVPVPEVYEAYESEGNGYILMSKLEGKPLNKRWRALSQDAKADVVEQLRGFVQLLQGLHGEFYGGLGRLPCEDIFFKHLCLDGNGQVAYGPFTSRREYNRGLVEALAHSRPGGLLRQNDLLLADQITAMDEETIVFSHGDLNTSNILIDERGRITGILDWEAAGYSIRERDYVEAKLGARSPEWDAALDRIFSRDFQSTLSLFKELNQSLVLYSGL